MKIGIDIHGVLSDVKFMKPIIHKLKAKGHELYVVSGAPVIDQMIELKTVYHYDLSIFSGFYSIVEYLYSSKKVSNWWKDEKDRWWFEPSSVWWDSKAQICEKYNIDILFDDELRYRRRYLLHRLQLYSKIYSTESTFDRLLSSKQSIEDNNSNIIYQVNVHSIGKHKFSVIAGTYASRQQAQDCICDLKTQDVEIPNTVFIFTIVQKNVISKVNHSTEECFKFPKPWENSCE